MAWTGVQACTGGGVYRTVLAGGGGGGGGGVQDCTVGTGLYRGKGGEGYRGTSLDRGTGLY